jgi:RimJ/RimL family protein N-acetyltransferase
MIKIVPFELSLFEGWDYDGVEVGMFDGTPDVISRIEDFCRRGRGYVALGPGGKVLGAAGIFPLYPWGVGHSWMMLNEIDWMIGLEIVRAIKEFEPEIMAELGFHRVQSEVMVDSRKAIELIELLGYSREGLMRKRGPNHEDMYLYAKVMG